MQQSQPVLLNLAYERPYDWETVLATLRAHQLPDLESVDALGYERVTHAPRGLGWFRVSHCARERSVLLSVWNTAEEDVPAISSSVRRMFDLDAKPEIIGAAMSSEPYLSSIWAQHPGLRVARSWSAFEAILATILGQLVSVSFARILVHEMMKAAGKKALHPKTNAPIYLFPTAEELSTHDLLGVRTSELRRTAMRGVAERFVDGTVNWNQAMTPKDLRKTLLSVPGIGAWSSEYIAMRGFGDDDAFPATDYVLKQELRRHSEVNISRVRPWRAYAAAALWKRFAETKGKPIESVV